MYEVVASTKFKKDLKLAISCRECHIQPDWLLIYEISNKELILYLPRTGTHSDLF